eukprot:g14292.t1
MAPDLRTRSPLRERERPTSPQRRDEIDYGQDAEKHVRHIARTRPLTAFAGQEGTQRNWPWVLQGLAHRRSDRGTGCPVDILNTVIYCDGSPETLYYTSGGNVVSATISEDEGCITFPKAMMHLRLPKKYVGAMKAANTKDSDAARGGTNGVVAFTSSGEAVAIKTTDVEKIRKGQSTPPTGTEVLVLLVPTKAPSAELLLSIQHTFILEPCAAKPVHRSYRLVILKGVPTRIPCQSSTINKKLCRLCKQVIQWIEAYSGGRVLQLVLEVVEDIYEHLWLVRSSECSTTKTVLPYSQERRSPSPAQSKTARLQSAKDIADELSLLRYGHAIGESAPSPTFGIDIQTTGHEQGPHRRAQTAMSPAEAGSSQGTLDAEEWGFNRSESSSSALLDSRRPQTVSTGGTTSVARAFIYASDQARENRRTQEGRDLQSVGVTFQGFAAPGEHDPREVGRTAAAGRALGSSQLSRMCNGDFCKTELLDKLQQQARFELEETGNSSVSLVTYPASPSGRTKGGAPGASEGATISSDTDAFRKRILMLDEATLQDHGVLPAEGGLMQSNRKSIKKLNRNGRGGTRDRGSMIDEARTKSVKRLDEQAAAVAAATGGADATRLNTETGRSRSQRHRAAKRARGGIGPRRTSRAQRSTIREQDNDGRSRGRRKHQAAVPTPGDDQSTSVILSGDGDREQKLPDEGSEAVSGESLALMRAQAAIDELTRGDIGELRSFAKPPAAVNMVAAALMIALTGHGEPTAAGWLSAKRYMTNIDKLFEAVATLDLNNLRVSQTRKLEAYVRNPSFRPDVIACVSRPASKICAWILGVLEAHRWRNGRGHPRIDTLGQAPGSGGGSTHGGGKQQETSASTSATPFFPSSSRKRLFRRNDGEDSARPWTSATATTPSRVTAALGPAVYPFPSATKDQPSQGSGRKLMAGGSRARPTEGFNPRRLLQPELPPKAWVPAAVGSESGGANAMVGSPTRIRTAPATGSGSRGFRQLTSGGTGLAGGRKERGQTTRAGRAAAKRQQDRVGERLANATAAAPDPAGFEGSEFLCTDGVTLMPYAVVGKGAPLLPESTMPEGGPDREGEQQPRSGSRDHGQKFRQEGGVANGGVLSFVVVHDFFDTLEKTFLLFKPLVLKYPGCQHVDNMGEMALSDRPFHLLGIGNGASIAAAFACKHASKSKFIFSEEYLKSVGSDLALNILCAVANPLGAEGMLRIVRGALRSRDLTKDLKSVALPLVLVQSTENMLIDAANVDPFLEGRRPRHVWSHQLRLRPTAGTAENSANGVGGAFVSCLGPSGEQALFESLSSGTEGAFVAWVKGGHEMRQECKRLVVDMLDLLAAPGGQTPAFFRRGVLARRPPWGRVGIAANTTSKTVKLKTKVTGPAASAVEEGWRDGLLPFSEVSSGDNHSTLAENGKFNDVEVTGTIVHAGTHVEGHEQEGEHDKAGQTVEAARDIKDGGGKNAAVEKGGAPGLTNRYASLRKIREREPLPEFPRSCGRRKWSPLAMECPDPVATVEQRTAGDWMKGVDSSSSQQRLPEPLAIAEAEAKLAEKVDRLQSKRLAAEREENETLHERRATKFEQERTVRAEGFAEEDRKTLAAEERRLAELRREADLGRLQRGAEFQEADEALGLKVASSSATTGATPMPVRGMRPQHFTEQEDLPAGIKKSLDRRADKVLDEMERLEARARAAGGGMNLEAFAKVEQRQRARQVERLEILHGQTAEEKRTTMLMMAVRLQMFARQRVARMRVTRLKQARSASKERVAAVIAIQSLVRGQLGRNSVRRLRKQLLDETILGGRATVIQKMYRGRLARIVYDSLLRDVRCRMLQKAARGFLGRRVAARKRELLARFAARASSATKLQSAWRGKMARDSYLRARCSWLASREIQRIYRGHLGRRAASRRREWQSAGPGPERLKLGLRMIEDTKVAFAKQQGEIAALNRAQEKAEARVSSIHHQLTASESELSVLEGEMAEIDHIERELVQLTHERDLMGRGITGAAGIPKTGKPRRSGGSWGGDDGDDDDNGSGGQAGVRGKSGLRKEDAYALEMQLQLKRAEREQRRLQLSAEFASTFADVSEKKRQLDRLSAAVADIEATRLRKSREFGHMQRNLMELLSEQKRELDIVRQKGVQLETAAATSAAAAAATAQRARDHEAKAAAMYGQTEELMKFQFMSMSLSYFSSLNMMKQMRDINADTTTAAIAGSADAAAAAAASAAAASIPSLKDTGDLGGDAISQALAVRKEQVQSTQSEIEEANESQRHPFPTELSLWTVDDVCRWLDTLQLGEYKQAFREGKVDGTFLGELRESDLMDSIGMEHKLHLKKLLLARQKLTPLSAAERSMASSVRREESAAAIREGIPDIDTAFSQARHGKKKRLEETLNTGFDINAEDHMGNTLLLVAVQQLQMPVVEFLVQRGANVNHSNATGNTALHFAMSYDTSGKMGEYLINNGADDTIENKQGLSPYDGI